MRLRSRMVGDAEDDVPTVASASSSSMDGNSSTEAVLGSPVTRRSWSTTHDSQDSSQNPAPVATSYANPNPLDQRDYEPDPQSSREHHPYLTGYETAAHTEYGEYPTEILSEDLYYNSQPQTHQAEGLQSYVQTSSSLPQPYNYPYTPSNPQTPIPPQLQYINYQTPTTSYSTTPTQPPLQRTSYPYPNSYQTPLSLPPSRILDYEQPNQTSSYGNYEHAPYSQLPPSEPLHTTFPPSQSHEPNDYGQQTHPQTSVSEPLTRYVTSDNEESWSPAAHPNPESHKRRISEADSTVGYRDKLRVELDEMGAGEGQQHGQQHGQRKKRRRTRGSGRGNWKGRQRSRSRSKDRGQGGERDKGDRGGNGQGRREGMRA